MHPRLYGLLLRVQQALRRETERGDVPGWVLVTLMTAGLVTVLWAVAGDRLVSLFEQALNSVRGPGRVTTARSERGAAVVEFALVTILLTVLFLGVLQVGLALYVRNTLVACASAGARYGADADRDPGDGAVRARLLIGRSLSQRYASSVSSGLEYSGGVPIVVVRIRAPLPVIGLVGPAGALTVSGHALREGTP